MTFIDFKIIGSTKQAKEAHEKVRELQNELKTVIRAYEREFGTLPDESKKTLQKYLTK